MSEWTEAKLRALIAEHPHKAAEISNPALPRHDWTDMHVDPTPGEGMRWRCSRCGVFTHSRPLSPCFGKPSPVGERLGRRIAEQVERAIIGVPTPDLMLAKVLELDGADEPTIVEDKG